MTLIISSLWFVLLLRLCYTQSLSSYFSVLKFHRLEATEIKTVYTEESYMTCFMECNKLVPPCKSVNIVTQPKQDGLHECVLLSERAPIETYTQALKTSGNYHYYTRLVSHEKHLIRSKHCMFVCVAFKQYFEWVWYLYPLKKCENEFLEYQIRNVTPKGIVGKCFF